MQSFTDTILTGRFGHWEHDQNVSVLKLSDDYISELCGGFF